MKSPVSNAYSLHPASRDLDLSIPTVARIYTYIIYMNIYIHTLYIYMNIYIYIYIYEYINIYIYMKSPVSNAYSLHPASRDLDLSIPTVARIVSHLCGQVLPEPQVLLLDTNSLFCVCACMYVCVCI